MPLLLRVLLVAYVIYSTHSATISDPDTSKLSTNNDLSENLENVHEECRNVTYCDVKPTLYPQDHFNQILRNNKFLSQPMPVLGVTFESHSGDTDTVDVCESQVTFKLLYQVRQKQDLWRDVVQSPEHGYIQRVRLEICTNPGASCLGENCGRSDYRTVCEQKYTSWQLLVGKEGNDTELIEIDLPTSCSCRFKNFPFNRSESFGNLPTKY